MGIGRRKETGARARAGRNGEVGQARPAVQAIEASYPKDGYVPDESWLHMA